MVPWLVREELKVVLKTIMRHVKTTNNFFFWIKYQCWRYDLWSVEMSIYGRPVGRVLRVSRAKKYNVGVPALNFLCRAYFLLGMVGV